MLFQDCTHRFFFEDIGVRGQWVKLSKSWQAAKEHQHCPDKLQPQLGQALSAAVLLASTIKFDGSLILQTQGTGQIRTLVAQATHNRQIRGLIRCNTDIVNSKELFDEGRLVLTINAENSQPYQGIVPLQGNNLATAIETYFTQSEQLNTRLWLTADESQAAGLLVQQLPSLSDNNDWDRVALLADTLRDEELLQLDCEKLLFRLFHEEKVRLFDSEPVEFACSCSRTKIENTLRLLGRDELESILEERGNIEVNCEFCNKHYEFDKIDTENLLLSPSHSSENSQIKH